MNGTEKIAIDVALVLLIIVLVWTSLRRRDGD
jgi:biopolymer transport protein ExbD